MLIKVADAPGNDGTFRDGENGLKARFQLKSRLESLRLASTAPYFNLLTLVFILSSCEIFQQLIRVTRQLILHTESGSQL